MVAHEIGNPLAAIKATIQSIEREAAAAGLQDPISAVYWEIDRLDKILAQLLGFVRHRAPRKVRTDVQVIVNKAKSAADSKLKKVTFKATYRGLPAIYADPDQLQQVFLNLFLNAADAMPDGGTLEVRGCSKATVSCCESSTRAAESHTICAIWCSESFYTTKPTGTGLGLSVCYRIVTDHGGSISVEGRDEKGTCILISLPFARSA